MPKYGPICGVERGAGKKGCAKPAHVKVTVLLEPNNTYVILFRCWEHYLDLENQGRDSRTSVRVVGAEFLSPETRKRWSQDAPERNVARSASGDSSVGDVVSSEDARSGDRRWKRILPER